MLPAMQRQISPRALCFERKKNCVVVGVPSKEGQRKRELWHGAEERSADLPAGCAQGLAVRPAGGVEVQEGRRRGYPFAETGHDLPEDVGGWLTCRRTRTAARSAPALWSCSIARRPRKESFQRIGRARGLFNFHRDLRVCSAGWSGRHWT